MNDTSFSIKRQVNLCELPILLKFSLLNSRFRPMPPIQDVNAKYVSGFKPSPLTTFLLL
jgi:hypothetical protein